MHQFHQINTHFNALCVSNLSFFLFGKSKILFKLREYFYYQTKKYNNLLKMDNA